MVPVSSPQTAEMVKLFEKIFRSVNIALAVDLASYDLVAVLAAHREFDLARLCREARLVLGARNLTGSLGAQPHVIRL